MFNTYVSSHKEAGTFRKEIKVTPQVHGTLLFRRIWNT